MIEIDAKRQAAVQLFKEIEAHDEFLNWKVNHIDVWPIVKELLFFYIYKPHTLKSILKLVRHKYELIKISNNISDLLELDNDISVVFSSGSTVRIGKENQSVRSRYFDPMADLLEEIGLKSNLLEYSKNVDNKFYRKERVTDIASSYYGHDNFKISDLKKLPDLNDFLKIVNRYCSLSKLMFLQLLKSKLERISIWKYRYINIIKSGDVKTAFVICYYSEPGFGMTIACNELKIPLIDMQHGAQGKDHFAYNYKNLDKALNTFPYGFWLWDQGSFNNINSWKTAQMLSIKGGNPSMGRRISSINKINTDRRIIAVTLQTGIKPYIPEFIRNAILQSTNKKDFLWVFRYHPRMSKSEIKEIEHILSILTDNDSYITQHHFSMPLDELLLQSYCHISHSSGSIIEADLCDVELNITYSNTGSITYKEMIDSNKLHFFDISSSDNFISFIERVKIEKSNSPSQVDWQKCLKQLMIKY